MATETENQNKVTATEILCRVFSQNTSPEKSTEEDAEKSKHQKSKKTLMTSVTRRVLQSNKKT